jgi:hypothetical protein
MSPLVLERDLFDEPPLPGLGGAAFAEFPEPGGAGYH